MPVKKTDQAAAYDVRARIIGGDTFPLIPYMPTIISCGFKVELPKGYCLKIHSRSSMAKNGIIIANSPGIIDSDFRGTVKVILLNLDSKIYNIKYAERIAQVRLEKNIDVDWIISSEISKTSRGEGGFGSTGKG
jgi:dUTP pyrophosphatase